MAAIFTFNTGKAIMEDATVKIAINDLSHIGPEKAILLGKVLIVDLFPRFKIVLTAHGFMFSPMQRTYEVLTDPQALANDYVVDFAHPAFGKVKIPGYPAHFRAMRAGTRSEAPTLGEHTEMVMRELGYTDLDIQKLKSEGVIGCSCCMTKEHSALFVHDDEAPTILYNGSNYRGGPNRY